MIEIYNIIKKEKQMKTNNIKLINYLLISTIAIITLTACGGGSNSKNEGDCKIPTADKDKDGFVDSSDVKPDEPFENGKFANLENVVNSEGVKHILKIAKERGLDVNLQLGNNPPKLNGIYRSETGGNVVYARNSDDGRTTGAAIIETEDKYCTTKGYSRRLSSSPYGFRSFFAILKGDGKYFTLYALYSYSRSAECMQYEVAVENGKVDTKSGDIKNYQFIIAPLGYEETRSGACAPYKGAKRIEEVFTTRDKKKVTDLDDLEYMCVYEGKAYVPTETWKNKDKESCKCTADIEIECE